MQHNHNLITMSIFYKVQERVNPQSRGEQKKFFLIEKSVGYINRERLIEDMCHHKSLTPQEASAALDYFFEAIPKFLKLGFTVGLKGLGYFYTSIKSKGSDTPEEADAHKKIITKVHFIAGKNFRDDINNTPIEKFPDSMNAIKLDRSHHYMKEEAKKEKTLEMAKNCLSEGLEMDLISRLTGLEVEYIKNIPID